MNVTAVAETLGWILVHFTWQGLAIGCVMLLLLMCIRRDRARVRYGVCCTGLLLLAIAPVVSGFYLAPTIEPAVTRVSPSVVPAVEPEAATDVPVLELPTESTEALAGTDFPDTAVETEPALPIADSQQPDWMAQARAWLPWVVGCWLAGVVLLMVRLLCGLHRVRDWRRKGAESDEPTIVAVFEQLCSRMKVRQCVRLLESARATVPTVIGWLRPVVLIPTSMLTNLTAAELESILAHELAHIRRHDYAINLLQTVLETLLFFHPVVWWLSRQTRIEREHCCDDIAIAACGDRPALARALAKMEELRCENRQLVAANGGVLVTRIRRILQKEAPDSSGGPAGIVTLLAVVALVITSALSVAGTPDAELNEREEEPIPMLPNEATDDDEKEDEETEERKTDDDNTYPVRKSEIDKVDSKTGRKKHVFPDIRLTAWHADKNRERGQASVDMVYTNVFNYTFIPQRVATKLNATVLGEIDFGEQAPVKKNLKGNAQLMDLLASAPDKSELQKRRLTVDDVRGPVGDEKVHPYASDATWIPAHLGFYGMNKTKQHVFRIVRLAKVNVGVGRPITNVNALVLADENSDFGVLGRNWSKRVRGKNGETLAFSAEGYMQLMAAPKPRKKPKAEVVERKELPAIKVVSRDGKRMTRAVVHAKKLSLAERQQLYQAHETLRKQRGLPRGGWSTSRETVAAGQTSFATYLGMDTSVLTLSVPEDTGMRAEFSGENIQLEQKTDRTIITITRGRVELIDESGVIRAKASADGGAELLIINATVSNNETVLVMRSKCLKDDGEAAPPVQVRFATDTGARKDDDVPHRGIRYTFEPPEKPGDSARLRRSIHLDMDRVGKELSDAALSQSSKNAPKQIVQVFEDGTLQLDDAKVSINELTELLKASVLKSPSTSVALRCDTGSSYQSVTAAMSACRAAGVQDITVEVRKVPGTDKDGKGDNQNAASNPKWGNAKGLNISDQMLKSYLAESRSWGPVAKSSKLRARLSLMTKNPRAGEPLRLKLELRNSGTEPEQYDAQYYSALHVLRVTNVATGKSDDFIGMTAQTAGQSVPLAANATVTLWESVDAADLFMLNEGTYKIQIASPLKNGTLPASNELTVVVAAGEQPPIKRLLGELIRIAPENWRVNKGWGGAFMVTHATSSVRESIAIQMWFTKEPLAADFQLGSGKNRQNVTTVGRFGTMGHFHIGAPPKVDELWPNHVRLLIETAKKTLGDKR